MGEHPAVPMPTSPWVWWPLFRLEVDEGNSRKRYWGRERANTREIRPCELVARRRGLILGCSFD